MAAIVRSQVITATGGSISSLNALFSSAVTAGNTIVVHYNAGGFPIGSTSGSSVLLFNPIDGVNSGAYSTAVSTQFAIASAPGGCGICYKLAISSGAAASTYRVRFDTFSAVGFASMACFEYSNIASFDKAAASAVSVSSSPTTVSQTATAVGNLFSAVGAIFSGSTQTARSTGLPTTMTVTITDQNNNNQLMISGEALNASSVTVQPIFRTAAASTWCALSAIFIDSTTAGGGRGYWPALAMVGCQEKTL